MAKKATTIILVVVVLFLLASTVYVSIILTSDTGTTPQQSRASEIEDATPEATTTDLAGDPLAVPTTDPLLPPTDTAADPLAVPTTSDTDPLAQTEDDIANDLNSEDAELTPTEAVDADGEEDLLAYANPTPPGAEPSPLAGTSPSVTPKAKSSPTPRITDSALPDTGKGQPKATASASVVPSQMVAQQQQQPNLPQSLPVAGSYTGPVMAFLVAGATIVAAFFL